jgi:type II secretory pathway component PulC
VWRGDVLATVKAGLGRFLEHVEIEARLVNGEFRGWRIIDLWPAAFWQGVDLRPGDLVISINGMPIEHETEAYAAFESLQTAPEISVAYYRGAEPKKLAFRVLDKPGAKAPVSK